MTIDFDITTQKWTIGGGKPKSRRAATLALEQKGFSHYEAEALLRANRLCAEIEARLPPPPSDVVTYLEARRLLFAMLRTALDRLRNRARAERWIRANLEPSVRRIWVYGLKHRCAADHHQRLGTFCYLPESHFTVCLRRCAFTVRDGCVFAKEVTDGEKGRRADA